MLKFLQRTEEVPDCIWETETKTVELKVIYSTEHSKHDKQGNRVECIKQCFLLITMSKIKATIIECHLLGEVLSHEDYLTEKLKHRSTIGIIIPVSQIIKRSWVSEKLGHFSPESHSKDVVEPKLASRSLARWSPFSYPHHQPVKNTDLRPIRDLLNQNPHFDSSGRFVSYVP